MDSRVIRRTIALQIDGTDRRTDGLTDRRTDGPTDRPADRPTDGPTGRHTGGPTDQQTNRPTNRAQRTRRISKRKQAETQAHAQEKTKEQERSHLSTKRCLLPLSRATREKNKRRTENHPGPLFIPEEWIQGNGKFRTFDKADR